MASSYEPGSVALVTPETAFVQGRDTHYTITEQLEAMLPPSWFSSIARRRGGVLWALMSAIGLVLANIKDVATLLKTQFRILTATGSTLDIISLDYFGSDKRIRLPRRKNENDTSFRGRIQSMLLLPHGTVTGIKLAVKYVTGAAPLVLENLNLNDYDSWMGVTQWDDTAKKFYVVDYLPYTVGGSKIFIPSRTTNQPVLASHSIMAFEDSAGVKGSPIVDFPSEFGLLSYTDQRLGKWVWWFHPAQLQLDFPAPGTDIFEWWNNAPSVDPSFDLPFRFVYPGTGSFPTREVNVNGKACARFGTNGYLIGDPTTPGIGSVSEDEWTLYGVFNVITYPPPNFNTTAKWQRFLTLAGIGYRGGIMVLGTWWRGTVNPDEGGIFFHYYPDSAPQENITTNIRMPMGYPFMITIRSKPNGNTVGGIPQADLDFWVNGTQYVHTTRDAVPIGQPELGTDLATRESNFELWEMLRFDTAHDDTQLGIVWEHLIASHVVPDGIPVPPVSPNLGTQAWGAKGLSSPYEFFVFTLQNPLGASNEAILDIINRAKPIATREHVFLIK